MIFSRQCFEKKDKSDLHTFLTNDAVKKPQVHEMKNAWFFKAAVIALIISRIAVALTAVHASIDQEAPLTKAKKKQISTAPENVLPIRNMKLQFILREVAQASLGGDNTVLVPEADQQVEKNRQSAPQDTKKINPSESRKENISKLFYPDLFRIPDEILEDRVRAHQYEDIIEYLKYIKEVSKTLQEDSERFKAGLDSWLKTVDIKANMDEYAAICDKHIEKMKAKKMDPKLVLESKKYNLERMKKGPQIKKITDIQYYLEDGTAQKNSRREFSKQIADSVNKLEFHIAGPKNEKELSDFTDKVIRVMEGMAANTNPENRTWSYVKNTFNVEHTRDFAANSDREKFYEYMYSAVKDVEFLTYRFKTPAFYIGYNNNYVKNDITIEHQIKEMEKKVGKLPSEAVDTIKTSYSRITGNSYPQATTTFPEKQRPRVLFEEVYFNTANGTKCEIFIMHHYLIVFVPHNAFTFMNEAK